MLRALLVAVALVLSPLAAAQTYPSKPIRLVVPFPVGGIADIYSRIVAGKLGELWGQNVLVDNRTGAGGNLGADMVAKAPADGYTVGIGSIGTHAVNVTLFSKMPYDAVKDFAPIALLVEAEGMLVVHPSVPVQSVT
jgi:tripartite-type tricarboxylate transporter receptor subunit TctC